MSRHVMLLGSVVVAVLLPASAFAGDGCADTVEVNVDRMGGLDDELLRIADLVGATPGPSPRLIRRGGPRRERICASALASPPFDRLAGQTVRDRNVELRAVPLRLR